MHFISSKLQETCEMGVRGSHKAGRYLRKKKYCVQLSFLTNPTQHIAADHTKHQTTTPLTLRKINGETGSSMS